MEWSRDDDGQWVAAVPHGRYVIRGGPGSWWFELGNPNGTVIAIGRVLGSPADVKVEVERRESH